MLRVAAGKRPDDSGEEEEGAPQELGKEVGLFRQRRPLSFFPVDCRPKEQVRCLCCCRSVEGCCQSGGYGARRLWSHSCRVAKVSGCLLNTIQVVGHEGGGFDRRLGCSLEEAKL